MMQELGVFCLLKVASIGETVGDKHGKRKKRWTKVMLKDKDRRPVVFKNPKLLIWTGGVFSFLVGVGSKREKRVREKKVGRFGEAEKKREKVSSFWLKTRGDRRERNRAFFSLWSFSSPLSNQRKGREAIVF